MPMSTAFSARLLPILPDIADHFGTPFHIYDEVGIVEGTQALRTACEREIGRFKAYFAVKALPNPRILEILRVQDFGFDCSSVPELVLARQVGAYGEELFFTSNNTTTAEFEAAVGEGGAILNLDDISLLDRLPVVPETICFRYNPGSRRTGNMIIGNPAEAKFGLTHAQIVPAYRRARAMGVRRFGLHTMIVSNERDWRSFAQTTAMLLDLAAELSEALGIRFEFVNIGGGMGIPYHPEEAPLDLTQMIAAMREHFVSFEARWGYRPALYVENGRYVTGPHGVLVTRVITRKETYQTYIGVDASMSALMRPGMYGAYHHIDVLDGAGRPTEIVDVVGSLCENNDKFAVQRELPRADLEDVLIIHDTGAHGHAMGFNYNGRLRPQELLLRRDGRVERIRRAETADDYFATLQCDPQPLHTRQDVS